MSQLIGCRLIDKGCGLSLTKDWRRLYLLPLMVVVALALATPTAAVPCPRIELPGYDCHCMESVERWVADCNRKPHVDIQGRKPEALETESTASPSTPLIKPSDQTTATKTATTTMNPTTSAPTSTMMSHGTFENTVTDSNQDTADGSHNKVAANDKEAKILPQQPLSDHRDDVENRVKTIGDPRGHSKREERVSSSKLNETNSQSEHLVRMQVYGIRTKRALPPSDVDETYIDPTALRPDFSIHYYPGSEKGELRKLLVRCDKFTMEIPSLVGHLGVKVNIFAFDNCPVPQNVTFAEVLDGNDVDLLQFEIKRPKLQSATLSKSPFNGLPDTIKDLIITSSSETDLLLRQFEDGFFANFTKLGSLTLRDNGISDLSQLRILTSLKELSLVGNPLSELNANTFSNLENLSYLQLSNCGIRAVHPDTFSNLTQLKHLNLAKNKLTSFPSKVFSNCRSLTDLWLDSNDLTGGLPEDVFDGLAKTLEELCCRSCNLQSLPATIFHRVPNMKRLLLPNNRIRHLDDETFRLSHNLVELSMPNNDLESLSNMTFKGLEEIETINLFENDLSALPEGIFSNNIRLKEIDLTGNYLSKLPDNFLPNQVNLQTLKLGHNRLTSLPLSLTGKLISLVHLNLSNNSLKSIPFLYLATLGKLASLDLSSNAIRSISMIQFHSMKIDVDLRNNPIETVTVLHREKLSKTDPALDYLAQSEGADRKYWLDTTQLHCDCHLLEFHHYLLKDNKQDLGSFGKDGLVCSTGKQIAKMTTSEFTCPISVEEGCPSERCKCFVEPLDNGRDEIIVNCTMAGLLNVTRLPPNVTNLLLQYNNLTEVPDLGQYKHLKKVNLTNNHIRDIGGFLMTDLPLFSVSFRNNFIKEIDQRVIKDRKITYNLELSGNPMTCNCDTVPPLADFITINGAQMPDNQGIVCSESFHTEENPNETRLVKFGQEYCPANLHAQQRQMKISIGVTIAVAALLIAAIILYYKHSLQIRIFLYIHYYDVYVFIYRDEPDIRDKTYDAFLSYSEHDADVMEEILAELERVDPETGERDFRLCVHTRDFEPSVSVVYNILNSIQSSRRTILILSKKFVESTYFNAEVSTALSEMSTVTDHRLIIVLKGEMPPVETMDKDLQKMLKDYTYIPWESRWFWDRLRYAMPHKRPRRSKRTGSNSKHTQNELDHAMHVLNKQSKKPTDEELARTQEQIENARNRMHTAAVMAPAADQVPSIFGRTDKIQGSAQPKILTGQINGAFEPLSMEEIRINCGSMNGDSFRSNGSTGDTQSEAHAPQREPPDPRRPVSARLRPNGVERPPRRKGKDSSDA